MPCPWPPRCAMERNRHLHPSPGAHVADPKSSSLLAATEPNRRHRRFLGPSAASHGLLRKGNGRNGGSSSSDGRVLHSRNSFTQVKGAHRRNRVRNNESRGEILPAISSHSLC